MFDVIFPGEQSVQKRAVCRGRTSLLAGHLVRQQPAGHFLQPRHGLHSPEQVTSIRNPVLTWYSMKWNKILVSSLTYVTISYVFDKKTCSFHFQVNQLVLRHFKAKVDCDQALQLDASYVKAYFRRGLCYVTFRNFDAALQDFSRVLELDPENREAKAGLDNINNVIISIWILAISVVHAKSTRNLSFHWRFRNCLSDFQSKILTQIRKSVSLLWKYFS